MSRYDVDLFVIGGGSGGVRAARVAAEHGARVAIAEESEWGGTCVVRGCVPKKLLVYASEVRHQIDDARGFGWTIDGARHDWRALIAAKDKEINRLSEAYVSRLAKAGCEVLAARATLTDAHTLRVGDRTITAGHILVATGGHPRKPAAGTWITSDEAFHLETLPPRIAILGGGYIAVEFAHIFAGLGAHVTLIHRDPLVLRGFDPEIRQEVTKGLTAHGIDVKLCTAIEQQGNTILVHGERIEVDLAMACIGRDPNTAGLGLDAAGVTTTAAGSIPVDDYSRTNVEHIYAVGDVTARVALTPVAIREGHAFADSVFGGKPTPVLHHLIPTAVFSQPAAATIGLSEPAAREAGHDIQIFCARFKPMKHTLSGRDERVMIKVIVDRATDKVLGVHMVGTDAPEIIQVAAIAVTMGATKADLDRTFALHPTTSEELVLLR
ncbi:MAG TPA: glutathione-disulfide reductase [Kofleriaceae bacterium]|jgi:glutathione reductase (NADPH)